MSGKTQGGKFKVQFVVSTEEAADLDLLASRMRTPSRAETLRRSVRFIIELLGMVKPGGHIEIVDADGTRTRIILL